MRVGLDIGSTTIKCVVLDEHDAILYSTYERHYSHILEKAQELLRRYEAFLEYALPLYVKEGKSQLTIAVGCTGGKHRSITFARKIGEFCKKLGYAPSVQHRDVNRSL